MTIPFIGAYADRGLSTGESVDVPLVICLDTGGSFTFFVNVVGVAD